MRQKIFCLSIFCQIPLHLTLLLSQPALSQDSPWQRIAAYFQPPAEFKSSASYRPLLVANDGQPVKDSNGWAKRRQEILEQWQTAMGPWPAIIEQPKVEVLKEIKRDEITARRVRLEIAPGQTGEGWLLIPPGQQPRPAVLVPFYEPETSAGFKADKPERDLGWQLAKRGMVTLNIGTPGGDAYKPEVGGAICQPLSFHAYVAANCWQAMSHMPEIDAKRIGVVGHSYGGKWSMFAGALWDKFAVVAVSDPGIAFDETRSNVNYWEPWYLGREAGVTRKAGVPTAENPTTGAYKRLRDSGHDLHEIQALICPRPYFVSGGSEDPPQRWQVLLPLIEVNRLLGYENRVGMSNRPDHSPNAESNAALVDFFEHFLSDKKLADKNK